MRPTPAPGTVIDSASPVHAAQLRRTAVQPLECVRPERLLYTPSEAAEALGVGRSTLYALMGKGRLPFVLIGRSRRVPVEALHTFIRNETLRQGFLP